MRLFLTLAFCIFTTIIYSQNDSNIKCVRFHHQNGVVHKSKIDIVVYQDLIEKDLFFVTVETANSNNKYPISREKLIALSEAVSKISPEDISKDYKYCLDAGTTQIEFSEYPVSPNFVKYSLSCLEIVDNQGPWKNFLHAVNLILDLAKLQFSDLK